MFKAQWSCSYLDSYYFIFDLGINDSHELKIDMLHILSGSFYLMVKQRSTAKLKIDVACTFFRSIGMAIQLGIMAAFLKPEIRQRVVPSR